MAKKISKRAPASIDKRTYLEKLEDDSSPATLPKQLWLSTSKIREMVFSIDEEREDPSLAPIFGVVDTDKTIGLCAWFDKEAICHMVNKTKNKE